MPFIPGRGSNPSHLPSHRQRQRLPGSGERQCVRKHLRGCQHGDACQGVGLVPPLPWGGAADCSDMPQREGV